MTNAQLGTTPREKPVRFVEKDVQIEVTAILIWTEDNGNVKVGMIDAYLTGLLDWETDHKEPTEKLLVKKKKKVSRNFSFFIFKMDFNNSKFVVTFYISIIIPIFLFLQKRENDYYKVFQL